MTARRLPSAAVSPAQPGRVCPECLGPVSPSARRGTLYCCAEHRDAFRNRWTVRGRVYAVMAAAARQTRDGTRGDTETGRWAASEANRLVTDFTDEDRAAGRMTAVEYMARARRAGVKGFR